MSASELPPIRNKNGSAKSRRSSRDSSSCGQPSRPTTAAVIRYEKPQLLSVSDRKPLIEGAAVTSPTRSATKRAHIGSGSTNGSNSPSQQLSAAADTAAATRAQLSRAKSWCATDAAPNESTSARLETLFEQNGMISGTNRKLSVGADRNTPKPTRTRLRSQPTSGTHPMTVSQRSLSNSVSNLSRTSDTNTSRTTRAGLFGSTTAVQRNRQALQTAHKFKSEQNLTSLGAATNAGRPDARKPARGGGCLERKLAAAVNNNNDNNNHNNNYNNSGSKNGTLRSSRSQPQLDTDEILTAHNLRIIERLDPEAEDGDSDSDSERNHRIQEWLLGTEDAELPDDQDMIVEEEPKQTDTAIHIVYDKD